MKILKMTMALHVFYIIGIIHLLLTKTEHLLDMVTANFGRMLILTQEFVLLETEVLMEQLLLVRDLEMEEQLEHIKVWPQILISL